MQATNIHIFKLLRSLCDFETVSDSDLKEMADSCRFANIEPGQYISTEGQEEGPNGFIVVSGCLAMQKRSNNGKELIVELLQAGDIFGLLLMLATDKLPYQLSARSIQKSLVLWVPIKNFMQILKSNELLFKDFVAHLLLCLQSSYKLSRGLAHDKVEVRIAATFSSLALKFPKGSKVGDVCIL